jgi:hypothetical protein
MFRQRQRERKLDVFFSAKKAQDVRRAMVNSTTGKKVPPAHAQPVSQFPM